MDKYAELRGALEAGPSLGEWSQEGLEVYADGCEFHPIAVCVRHPSCEPQEVCEANAGYIAACHPEAIRALLAERDALREALWVATEHNALHFGETHNTVIQGRAALAQGQGGIDGDH